MHTNKIHKTLRRKNLNRQKIKVKNILIIQNNIKNHNKLHYIHQETVQMQIIYLHLY
jgi:hypothetical protein